MPDYDVQYVNLSPWQDRHDFAAALTRVSPLRLSRRDGRGLHCLALSGCCWLSLCYLRLRR